MSLPSRERRLNSTRIVLVSIIAAFVTVTAAPGQQASASGAIRAELLAQLRSDDAEVRMEAFKQLRSDPTALRDPKVKAALISLLDRENREPVFGEEEDYADYTSWLLIIRLLQQPPIGCG